MPARRRLSDHQLIAARWEYEVTPISERRLAAKYGLSRSAIHDWIVKQGWTRAEVLRSYDGEEGQKQFQRDVRAAVKQTCDRKVIQALEQSLMLPPAGKLPTSEAGGNSSSITRGAWGLCPDQPQSPAATGKKTPKQARGGQVVNFPGINRPSPSPETRSPYLFPPRSRTEEAATRVQLASLHGELVLQQVEQLKLHDELLWDYHHLIHAYLNPGKFVDVTDLDPEAAAARLKEVSAAAGRLVLPTERDTLAGVILTLSKSLHASFAAARAAVGVTPRQVRGRGSQNDEAGYETPPDLGPLDVPSLRIVSEGMALLRGHARRHDEPPKPPPPEGLDDLMGRDGALSMVSDDG